MPDVWPSNWVSGVKVSGFQSLMVLSEDALMSVVVEGSCGLVGWRSKE